MINRTNIYKFSQRPEILEYGELNGYSGYWWMDSEEWHERFKPWDKEREDAARVDQKDSSEAVDEPMVRAAISFKLQRKARRSVSRGL